MSFAEPLLDLDFGKSYESISPVSIRQAYKKLLDSEESVKCFDDIVTTVFNTARKIWIADIIEGAGTEAAAMIQFWNHVDDCDRIPADERRPIVIYINSNGGDLDETFCIVDAIRMSITPVYTVNIGCAYSGGAMIAVSGHRRYCYKHATYLFHEGSVANVSGDAHKFRNFGEFYKKRVEQIKDLIVESTSITEDEYEEKRKDDWWFTAKEALSYGMVDYIMTDFPNEATGEYLRNVDVDTNENF